MMRLFQTKLAATPLAGIILGGFIMTSCGSGDSTNTSTAPPAATGTTVQVSASATDPDNATTPGLDTLHYRWAATEGTIDNVNKPTTTWTIPQGSGLQFAYVLVSDGKGGYTESRAAALTFGTVPEQSTASLRAPQPQKTKFLWGALYADGFNRRVYLPDWDVKIAGPNAPTDSIKTDKKGEFFFAGLSGDSYTLSYRVPGSGLSIFTGAIPVKTMATSPSSSNYSQIPLVLGGAIRGSVRLKDQSYCGIRNEFFINKTKDNFLTGSISATVELLLNDGSPVDSDGIPGPPITPTTASVNHYGDYLLVPNPPIPGPFKVRISCEDLPSQDVLVSNQTASLFLLPNSRPVIDKMTVTLGGRDVGRPDLPKPQTLTSDNSPLPLDVRHEMNFAPGDDAFLAYKGIDTRKGACAYYFKIGAVQGCDADGFPTGAQLTLDQWQKTFNLSPFHDGNPAEPEFKAIYINKQDLNLTRDMQAIKLQRDGGTLAYNVCNYPGAQNVNDPLGSPKLIGEELPPDINLAIENAKRGIGKVACVAMDYTPATGVRFYTFSPSGKLLLSISLDGRREKFMPGTCIGCHGGDNYGGKFADNYTKLTSNDVGPGQADLGSYFLPFDVANFYFSTSDPSLSRTTLLIPLRRMNELLASVPGNPAVKPIVDDLKALITTR